jgi:hypothetical protein
MKEEGSDTSLPLNALTEISLPSPPDRDRRRSSADDDDVKEVAIGLRQSVSTIDLMDRKDYYRKSSKVREKMERASVMEHPGLQPVQDMEDSS